VWVDAGATGGRDAPKGVGTMTRASVGARWAMHQSQAHDEVLHEQSGHTSGHRRLSPFWRHFLEMLAVMVGGMLATGAIFVWVVGLVSWDEITSVYPTQALVAMAVGMTAPMVAWMLYRGMGLRNSYEMALAMVLPLILFLCLVWFNVTESAQCGGYCTSTVVAMLLLMRYRRSEYSMEM
jgi:hypothetical protein